MTKQKKAINFLFFTLFTAILFSVSAYASSTLNLKAESNLSITSQDEVKYIIGFSEGKKVSELLKHFKNSSEIKAYKNNVALGENEIVSTGTLISCGSDEAYVVIKGDTDGDGSVNATDYLQVKKYFLGTYEMDKVYLLAADTQSDGFIDATDYLQIKGYFLETYNLYPVEKTYSVTSADESALQITNGGNHIHGKTITVTANVIKLGYRFAGWYSGDTLLSTSEKYTFTIDKDVVGKVEIAEEMQMFEFISTATTCEIIGFKDSSATEVIIPDVVTSIGDDVFKDCENLKSVTFGKNVTSIGDYAFYYCTSIERVNITDIKSWCGINFKYFGSNPIYFSGDLYLNGELVVDLVIPDGVTSMGAAAFGGCKSIESVIIPDSVTSIDSSTFRYCTNLKSVTLSKGVKSIGYYVFGDCTSLANITIPDSVTSIGEGAFYNCRNFVNITIPDSVTSIGKNAFYGCKILESITLPFVGATKDGTSNTHFGYIFGASSYTNNQSYVPSTLKSVIITGKSAIGERAFYNCSSLINITITNNVTSVGNYAFSGCESIKSVNITNIKSWCGINFGEYDSNPLCYAGNLYLNGELVVDLVIPNGLKSIGSYAFDGCTSIKSVTIPKSVTSVGAVAFSDCKNLERVNITDMKSWVNIYFKTLGSNPLYHAENLYLNGELVVDLVIPDGVTYVSGLWCCTSLESVIIPDSVTSIDWSAFRSCTNLKSAIIGDSVKVIDDYAFSGCTSLENITIPDSVTSIGEGAFYNCSKLVNITIPDSVTSIGDKAFCYCTGLANITIPNSVTSIGRNAFYDCTGLANITIPNSVTSIGESAFCGCNNLVSITLPFVGSSSSVISYSPIDSEFSDDQLFGYIFGSRKQSNTSNGTNLVYQGQSSHTDVFSESKYYRVYYIPSSLRTVIITNATGISAYAFYGCDNLTSITINSEAQNNVYSNAFTNCTATVKYN